MKTKLLLAVLISMMSLCSYGQNINFGFTGGVVFTALDVEGYSDEGTSKSRTGFTFGVLAEVNLPHDFLFQPGLNFIQKGGTWEFPSGTDKFILNYIELPLNFVYKRGKILVGVGPSVGFGLNGKLKAEFNSGENYDYDASFASNGDHSTKRIEIGGNVMAGYEILEGLFLAANFNLSLNENSFIIDESIFNGIKNRYLGIRVGYIIRK